MKQSIGSSRRRGWFRYVLLATVMHLVITCHSANASRERISINDGWRFMKYDPEEKVDELIYDLRPEVRRRREIILGEDAATAAVSVEAKKPALKSWVMPTGNDFISDAAERHSRLEGDPGSDLSFVQAKSDDASWERVDLPHFMGYRFGLFNMATQSAGGYVDFDYYRVSDEIAIVD